MKALTVLLAATVVLFVAGRESARGRPSVNDGPAPGTAIVRQSRSSKARPDPHKHEGVLSARLREGETGERNQNYRRRDGSTPRAHCA